MNPNTQTQRSGVPRDVSFHRDLGSNGDHSSKNGNTLEPSQRLGDLLADGIEAKGHTRPEVTNNWRDAASYLLHRSSEQDIAGVIRYVLEKPYWLGRCASLPSLRNQFNDLRTEAEMKGYVSKPGRVNGSDWRARIRQLMEGATHPGGDPVADFEVNEMIRTRERAGWE